MGGQDGPVEGHPLHQEEGLRQVRRAGAGRGHEGGACRGLRRGVAERRVLVRCREGGADSVLVFMENWDEASAEDPRIWRYTFDGEKMHVQDGRFIFD